ncbi:MAG: nickel pincer cofactor biosynthesis protein LarC [Polyangiales bacterium]
MALPPRRFAPGTRFTLGRPSTESASAEPYEREHNRPHVHDPHSADHGHSHTHDHPHDHSHSHAAHWSEITPRKESATAAPRVALDRGDEKTGDRAAKVLHFDCFSGLAGDMIVAALIDLGVPLEPIRAALEALPIEGYSADVAEVEVASIAATRFVVEVQGQQPYRTWSEIRVMLESAALAPTVKARALATFEALAVAEAKIHRVAPEQVHFHEVGAVDAIVDIVSACAALDWLGATISCAPLPMGRGFTRSEHGRIPLPAPAVLELLAGIPTIDAGIAGELVTPTGAALVRANATQFVQWPSIRPSRTGFGAGTKSLPDRPNVLRVVLGERVAPQSTQPARAFATHVQLETNVDDTSGEMLAHACAALLREGALDAWTESIGMKKSRPAVKLCALARAEDRERMTAVMLREVPTLGVRAFECTRIERPRREITLQTPWGPLPCKISMGDGLPPSAKPEDDAVAALAQKAGVPARIVREAAMAALVRDVLLPGALASDE